MKPCIKKLNVPRKIENLATLNVGDKFWTRYHYDDFDAPEARRLKPNAVPHVMLPDDQYWDSIEKRAYWIEDVPEAFAVGEDDQRIMMYVTTNTALDVLQILTSAYAYRHRKNMKELRDALEIALSDDIPF